MGVWRGLTGSVYVFLYAYFCCERSSSNLFAISAMSLASTIEENNIPRSNQHVEKNKLNITLYLKTKYQMLSETRTRRKKTV